MQVTPAVDAVRAVGGGVGHDDAGALADVQSQAGRPAQDPENAAVGEPATLVDHHSARTPSPSARRRGATPAAEAVAGLARVGEAPGRAPRSIEGITGGRTEAVTQTTPTGR